MFCSYTKLTVALGKGIQYQGFQELSSWMDCCLQSAIHRGWKAWVLTSFGVYAHVLQTTWYSTLNHLEESHHGNRWRHSWGHLKDDQGMTFLATCCCKYWTWLLGTWWQCEPISQCLDIKRWPCFLAIVMHWINGEWKLSVSLFALCVISINWVATFYCRGVTHWFSQAHWCTLRQEFSTCCLQHTQPLQPQGAHKFLSLLLLLYTRTDYDP